MMCRVVHLSSTCSTYEKRNALFSRVGSIIENVTIKIYYHTRFQYHTIVYVLTRKV